MGAVQSILHKTVLGLRGREVCLRLGWPIKGARLSPYNNFKVGLSSILGGTTEQAIHGTATPPLINATAGAHITEFYCGTRTTSCYAAVVVMNASSTPRQNRRQA
jgi:hypothetical protein